MDAISVSKLNNYIKNIFEAEEFLHNILVIGEVFGVSYSKQAIYFSLKDDLATLSCICFYPNFKNQIIEGEKVIVTGSLNYYVKGGKLSFNVIKIEKQGQGILYEEFLKLKDKLENEGLFSPIHKKSLPSSINRIGVITSSEGAVIQDIKNIVWRRNPNVDIVLYSTKVQGKNAEKEIAHAIKVMSDYAGVDVLVVARGGGSYEDLSTYNTEIVARAAFNCQKPLVSAVGHETDFTIIDFVSDLRAPTPSAAAELLTFVAEEQKQESYKLGRRLQIAFRDFLELRQAAIGQASNSIRNYYEKYFMQREHNFSNQTASFYNRKNDYINERIVSLGLLENSLNKLNPSAILKKGYAKIEQSGKTISEKSQVDVAKTVEIIFLDGSIKAKPES